MIIRDNRLGQRSHQSSMVFSSQKIILFFPPFAYLLNHVYPFVFSPLLVFVPPPAVPHPLPSSGRVCMLVSHSQP